MTATVDNTPTLPEPQAQPNAPIVDDDGNQGGLKYIARSVNTAYEKARTQLVAQWAVESQPLITDTTVVSAILRWRVKTLGNSGGEVSTEVVNGWVAVYWEGDAGSPAATITATVSGASTTDTQSITYSTDTVGDFEWIQLPDFAVDDDQEFLDVELGIVVNTDMVRVSIYGAAFFYECSRSSLVVDGYSNGFTPVHDAAVTSNAAWATRIPYALHENARVIYQTRQGGNLVTDCLPALSGGGTTTKVYDVRVPLGVPSVRVWLYASGNAIGSDTINVTLGDTTDTINRNSGASAWEFIDCDVSEYQGTWQVLTIECAGVNAGVASVCAYAKDIT